MPTENILCFFFVMLILRIALLCLLWFPCMSTTTHETHSRAHTHVRKSSAFIQWFNGIDKTEWYKSYVKFQEERFNDAETNQLTIYVVHYIAKFVLNLLQVPRISNTSHVNFFFALSVCLSLRPLVVVYDFAISQEQTVIAWTPAACA